MVEAVAHLRGGLKLKFFQLPKCTWVALLGRRVSQLMIYKNAQGAIFKLIKMFPPVTIVLSQLKDQDMELNQPNRCYAKLLRWDQVTLMLVVGDNSVLTITKVIMNSQWDTCNTSKCHKCMEAISRSKNSKCMGNSNNMRSLRHSNSMEHPQSNNNNTVCLNINLVTYHNSKCPSNRSPRHMEHLLPDNIYPRPWLPRLGRQPLLRMGKSTITMKRLGKHSGTNRQGCHESVLGSYHRVQCVQSFSESFATF
mmetsp:Transcript_11170/g.17261  ORF Transcript_11170/g.17261 Transcript_11170/m.17261 type:complete len:252 (+) Transcript_11170:1317-2072(+)